MIDHSSIEPEIEDIKIDLVEMIKHASEDEYENIFFGAKICFDVFSFDDDGTFYLLIRGKHKYKVKITEANVAGLMTDMFE